MLVQLRHSSQMCPGSRQPLVLAGSWMCFAWYGTVTMGHTRALVTVRTVRGSMMYINNNQLASEFLQLLSGDGQTIDNDIQRRADTVTTSMQIHKSIGNILGRPFHLLGTALLAARQIQKAGNSAKHVWTPSTAQDQYFSASPSSEDDLTTLTLVTQHVVPSPSSSWRSTSTK